MTKRTTYNYIYNYIYILKTAWKKVTNKTTIKEPLELELISWNKKETLRWSLKLVKLRA